MSIVLDGKALAKQREAELSARVAALKQKFGIVPKLATVLIGDDPASATYVRMKQKACERVGIEPVHVGLKAEITTVDAILEVQKLNADPTITGILVQHPLPRHIDERSVFENIFLKKDVDGVTTTRFGQIALGMPTLGSATPAGIMKLLQYYGIQISGKHAVVVGRSAILGKPMAAMLLNANATVTVCHSKTENLQAYLKDADILVAAVGKPEAIKASWLTPGVVVVDVGFHPGGFGDVEKAGLAEIASAYTPVPGGVGPMTISTLLENCIEAAEKAERKSNVY